MSAVVSWMVYGTLLGGAVAAMAWGAEALQRASRRPTRHLWVIAMVSIALVMLGAAIRPRVVAGLVLPETGIQASGAPVADAPMVATSGRALAAWGWAAGSAMVLLVVTWGMVALMRTRRRGVATAWYGTAVLETDDVGPGAAPWGHPAILVPRTLRELPEPSARLLLAHEREHVATGDARLMMLMSSLLVVMPWNLPLWWCFLRLRTAVECDCDARVLGRGVSLGDYASLLLDLAAPRRRPLPALLAFAPSRSQLRTRIDAMTTARTFSPFRRTAWMALVAVAGVVACETRMPAPVAPVTDYVVKDGKAAPVVVTETKVDSVRSRLVEGVDLTLVAADSSMDPLLVVRNASGAVVYQGRAMRGQESAQFPSQDEIASVEVMKGRAALPEGARGGMIVVRLKPDASWTGPTADTGQGRAESGRVRVRVRPDSSVREVERPAAVVRGRAMRDSSVRMVERPVAVERRVEGRDSSTREVERPVVVRGVAPVEVDRPVDARGERVRVRAWQDSTRRALGTPLGAVDTVRSARAADGRMDPMVSVIDADGREVWTGRGMTSDVDGRTRFGQLMIAPADIARVEVFKGASAPEGGLITVHLKAGAKITKP